VNGLLTQDTSCRMTLHSGFEVTQLGCEWDWAVNRRGVSGARLREFRAENLGVRVGQSRFGSDPELSHPKRRAARPGEEAANA
jgi:hypothetical protein